MNSNYNIMKLGEGGRCRPVKSRRRLVLSSLPNCSRPRNGQTVRRLLRHGLMLLAVLVMVTAGLNVAHTPDVHAQTSTPAQATNITVAPGYDGAAVTWTVEASTCRATSFTVNIDAVTFELGVAQYDRIADKQAEVSATTSGRHSHAFTGLKPNSLYRIGIISLNSDGSHPLHKPCKQESREVFSYIFATLPPPSTTITSTTTSTTTTTTTAPVLITPTQATNLRVAPGRNEATITWTTEPSTSTTCTATSFKLNIYAITFELRTAKYTRIVSKQAEISATTSGGLSHTFTGLEPSSFYQIGIISLNENITHDPPCEQESSEVLSDPFTWPPPSTTITTTTTTTTTTTSITTTTTSMGPVIDPIDDVSVELGQAVNIEAVASDSDGDPLTYLWTRAEGETVPAISEITVFDTPRLVFLPTVDPRTMTGTYTMTVTVSDPSGNKAIEGVVITVRARSEPTPNVIIESTELEVKEGGGAYFTVKLDTIPNGTVTVILDDVVHVKFDSLNWDTPQTRIYFAPLNDELGTRNTAWETSIKAPGTIYELVNPPDIVVKIEDDTAILQLSSDPQAVIEGENITFTVDSSYELVGMITLPVILSDRGSSGFHADDIVGELSQVVKVNFGSQGSTTGTANIATARDTAVTEGAETYTITLKDDSDRNGYILGTDITADGTLNDRTPSTQPTVTATNTVTVTPTAMTLDEGSRGGYTVVLGNAPTDTVTITIKSDSHDVTMSTVNPDHNNLVFTTSNWNVPQQVYVWTIQDQDTANDTATFTHTATGSGYNKVNIPKVTVSVTDN